jgi:hypothetical protein
VDNFEPSALRLYFRLVVFRPESSSRGSELSFSGLIWQGFNRFSVTSSPFHVSGMGIKGSKVSGVSKKMTGNREQKSNRVLIFQF